MSAHVFEARPVGLRQPTADDADDPAAVSTDPAAWIQRHQTPLYWYLRSLRCPADLIEDCMQEALTRAIRRPFVLRMRERSAGRWLRTTARNAYLMELRRRRRRPEILDLDAVDRAFEELHDTRLAEDALRACIDGLAPRAQRAVELRYHQGAGRAVMARELGVSEDGVKSMLRRIRSALRACVEEKLR